MNLGVVKNMCSGSSASSLSGLEQFPAGLRVLAVDDDPICLKILEKMLQNCLYQVTKCNRAEIALSLLRENKNGFDIVISDVHMPDMDGFKLLEHIGLEMDLPVIMMSADDSKDVVMKGVTHGACDYLIKPVRIEALKNIWQHVVRKKKHEWKDKDIDESGSLEDGDRQQKPLEDADYSSSANEGNWKSSKKRKDEEDETDERDDTSTLKKPRVVWSVELHQQFVQAVNQLGIDKAVPKKILELMNVPGLTRENVASHLQKYRLYLRRLSGSHHQNGLNNVFMGHPEPTYGPMSSFNGFELQALAAATGQLPPESLATLQAAALGRSATKSSLPMPLVDQRNLFSFENPKLRFPESQPQQLNNSSNKQINLLHGIPTSMEPNSFVAMNMRTNSRAQQNNSLLMQMSQQNNASQVLRAPSSMSQPLSSSPVAVLSRNGIVTQASSMVDFSMNQNSELQNNGFPLVSNNSGMSSLTSNKGMSFQEEVNSGIKGPRGFPTTGYNIFGELGPTFDASHHSNIIPGTLNVSPSMLVQQGISSAKRNGQNGHSPMGGAQLNSLLGGNLITVKTEQFHDASSQSIFYPEQFGQDELMNALLKQQENVGPVEPEFGFDGYSPLDNLPV